VFAYLAVACVGAADSIGEPGRGSSNVNPLKNVYFGEQHLHTQDSPDAFAMGTRNSQDDSTKAPRPQPVVRQAGEESPRGAVSRVLVSRMTETGPALHAA
jgi:hypothetical protein